MACCTCPNVLRSLRKCKLPDWPPADASWSEEVLCWAAEHLPKPQHVPLQRSISQPGIPSGCTLCAEQKLALSGAGSRGVVPHLALPGQAELSCHHQQQQQQHLLGAQQGLPAELQLPQQLFRGLRVRMAVASGIADGVKLHKVTRRVEYNGTTMRRVQAVADAPKGGQVSCSTYESQPLASGALFVYAVA